MSQPLPLGDLVNLALDGHVAVITLNDPERRNSLSPELVETLIATLAGLSDGGHARAIVLTGAGSAFSAGGDPKRMLQPGLYPDMSPFELRRFYQDGVQRLPLALQAVRTPIVAAVNGPAIGAGCDLACLCDVRIAAEGASFASSFVKLGLVPGDGGAWILPRVVGLSNALQLMLTGETIDAVAAQRIGLVSGVAPADGLMAQAMGVAQRIAANPPHATQLAKALVYRCQTLDLPGALELSAAHQALAHKTEDHREAVTAFLERRTPVFNGR